MDKIFFISGVNGVGKSTIIPLLTDLLPKSKFSVFDFDERGVPDDADRNWRRLEAKYWIKRGTELVRKGKTTVVCGFVKPDDLDLTSIEIKMILLDAKSETIHERLTKRYTQNSVFDESRKVIGKPVKQFIEDNVYMSSKMKDIFRERGYSIVDTSNLTPGEVAGSAVRIILKG